MKVRAFFIHSNAIRFFLILAILAVTVPVSYGGNKPNESNDYVKFEKSIEKKNFKKALRHAQSLAKKFPESPLGWSSIAGANLNLGNYSIAVDNYTKALKLDPENVLAHLNLGVAFGKVGKTKDAISSLKLATELEPKSVDAHRMLGYSYAVARSWKDSVASYRRVTELEPNNAGAYHALGVACEKLGEYKEAIDVFQRSIELEPNSPVVYAKLGGALLQAGKVEQSIKSSKHLIKLDPGNPYSVVAMANLAVAHIKLGDLDRGGIWAARKALAERFTEESDQMKSIRLAFEQAQVAVPTDLDRIRKWIRNAQIEIDAEQSGAGQAPTRLRPK